MSRTPLFAAVKKALAVAAREILQLLGDDSDNAAAECGVLTRGIRGGHSFQG